MVSIWQVEFGSHTLWDRQNFVADDFELLLPKVKEYQQRGIKEGLSAEDVAVRKVELLATADA